MPSSLVADPLPGSIGPGIAAHLVAGLGSTSGQILLCERMVIFPEIETRHYMTFNLCYFS